jgi:hypothetical protein
MSDASKCAVCNEHGHTSWRCPELCAPLREGFYTGGGGGGGHSHDDDEAVDGLTCAQKVDLLTAALAYPIATNNEHDARCPNLTQSALSALPISRLRQDEQFWAAAMASTCCV